MTNRTPPGKTGMLPIFDKWPEQRHDMLEILEDRYGHGATLITSQIPVRPLASCPFGACGPAHFFGRSIDREAREVPVTWPTMTSKE
jgi:hypothetical protein